MDCWFFNVTSEDRQEIPTFVSSVAVATTRGNTKRNLPPIRRYQNAQEREAFGKLFTGMLEGVEGRMEKEA